MNDDITNYPLSWPFGWERTLVSYRKRSQFGHHSIIFSARTLEHEVRLMGGRSVIISTNLRVRNDGLPYSNQRTPDDCGVAVYFHRKGKDLVFPCDKFRTVEDNLWAIVKHLEAMRGQERWGVGTLDQAFMGYAALPDPNSRKWWEVLGVNETASDSEIDRAHIDLAKRYHPDKEGGSTEMFIQIQQAYELAKKRK